MYLGMRDLASSGLSGHKLARAASSNLCNFFCISKLEFKKKERKKKVRKKLGMKSLIHSGKKQTNQTFKSINLRMAAIVSRFLNLLKR